MYATISVNHQVMKLTKRIIEIIVDGSIIRYYDYHLCGATVVYNSYIIRSIVLAKKHSPSPPAPIISNSSKM
jgi:hypothetical protein